MVGELESEEVEPLLEGNTIISRNPRVEYRDQQEEGGVLLNLDTNAYHSVNQVGGLVWKLIKEDTRFDELVKELRRVIKNPPSDMEEDLSGYLEGLQQRDLVWLISPSA